MRHLLPNVVVKVPKPAHFIRLVTVLMGRRPLSSSAVVTVSCLRRTSPATARFATLPIPTSTAPPGTLSLRDSALVPSASLVRRCRTVLCSRASSRVLSMASIGLVGGALLSAGCLATITSPAPSSRAGRVGGVTVAGRGIFVRWERVCLRLAGVAVTGTILPVMTVLLARVTVTTGTRERKTLRPTAAVRVS